MEESYTTVAPSTSGPEGSSEEGEARLEADGLRKMDKGKGSAAEGVGDEAAEAVASELVPEAGAEASAGPLASVEGAVAGAEEEVGGAEPEWKALKISPSAEDAEEEVGPAWAASMS